MKKVLFFINTLGMGGAEHVLVDIVNSLDPKKFDITIKTIYDTNVFQDALNNNIKVESFYKSKKNKLIDKVFRKILYLKIMNFSEKKLYKMIIKEKYDIEIAFLEGLPTKIISGSNNKKSKKIAWVHTDLVKNTESYGFFKSLILHENSYKKFDEIYCVSDEVYASFNKLFNLKNKTYVMYNIINRKRVLNKAKEKVELKNGFNFINVGRLTEQKGHIRLLKVYAKVLKKLKFTTHLYIIGDGVEKTNIEREIKKLNLSENVTMLGQQSNPYKFMKKSDLYICSSFAEGYSLVIMEALTLGLPVLTTDCAGQKQILNNGEFGLIVDNTEKDLEVGLLSLVNDKEKLNNYKVKIKKNYEKYENSIEKIENQLLK